MAKWVNTLGMVMLCFVGLLSSRSHAADQCRASLFGVRNPDLLNLRQSAIPPPSITINHRRLVLSPVNRYKESDTPRRLARPIGRLELKVRTNYGRICSDWCTAEIVSSEYVLTNYHCVENTILDAQIRMNYLDKNSSNDRVYKLKTSPLLDGQSNEALDYALLKFATPNDAAKRWGTVGLKARSPIVPPERVMVLQHPYALPMQFVADCLVREIGDVSLSHDCPTEHGSSGSLLISAEDGVIVGLHNEGTDNPDDADARNYGIEFAKIIADSPTLKSLAMAPKMSVKEEDLKAVGVKAEEELCLFLGKIDGLTSNKSVDIPFGAELVRDIMQGVNVSGRKIVAQVNVNLRVGCPIGGAWVRSVDPPFEVGRSIRLGGIKSDKKIGTTFYYTKLKRSDIQQPD